MGVALLINVIDVGQLCRTQFKLITVQTHKQKRLTDMEVNLQMSTLIGIGTMNAGIVATYLHCVHAFDFFGVICRFSNMSNAPGKDDKSIFFAGRL